MALLDRLRRKGKGKMADGGRTIVQELEVALNPNGGWYAGLDMLNANLFEPFSAAEFDWKQAYVPAVWSGLDKLKNQGELATINLVASLLDALQISPLALLNPQRHSRTTRLGAKQMSGMQ